LIHVLTIQTTNLIIPSIKTYYFGRIELWYRLVMLSYRTF